MLFSRPSRSNSPKPFKKALFAAGCIALVAIADAGGYDEAANSGLLNPELSEAINYTSGLLRLEGFSFGEQGTVQFSTWADRLQCKTTQGQTAFEVGQNCAISAIAQGTLIAANGVITGQGTDLANQVLFKVNRETINKYEGADSGQGPSCSANPVQNRACNVADSNKVPPELIYDIPTRLIKITCKKACPNAGGAIQSGAGTALMEQVARNFINNNWWAARFSIRRVQTGSDVVLARCRITIPTLGRFPEDNCPDWIPGSGATRQAIESQYPVSR